ncbi:hypothetical protein JG687_00008092 [Phytophthora cactorum]|uniref:Uncharacterized protein n=1 Tax=Phytophthora cactorum TaxID=29920 RepID=A0A8T1UF87_9STRA|nr:hypothetical protein JG687_00008092 [Phytophthora cactorum]
MPMDYRFDISDVPMEDFVVHTGLLPPNRICIVLDQASLIILLSNDHSATVSSDIESRLWWADCFD